VKNKNYRIKIIRFVNSSTGLIERKLTIVATNYKHITSRLETLTAYELKENPNSNSVLEADSNWLLEFGPTQYRWNGGTAVRINRQ
jgi:hypothetical protein